MRFTHALMILSCALPAQLAIAAGQTVVVIKTADPSIATGAAQALAVEMPPEIPALPEKSHFVVSVDEGGALTVTTAEGDVGVIDVMLKPALCLDVYADQIASAKMMASMIGGQAAAQGGATEEQVNDAIGKAFDFPKQIDVLTLSIRGDETAGYKAALELTPVKATGFANFVGNIKSSAIGAPVVGDGKGVIEGFVSLDKTSMTSMMDAVKSMAALGGGGNNPLMKQWDRLLAFYDGTIGFTMGGSATGSHLAALAGVTDSDGINSVYADPTYRKDAESATTEQMKLTMKWDAYEHRGVKVHQSTGEMENAAMMGPNPLFQDGKLSSEFAATGDCFVMTMNGGEGMTKKLLDQAIDGKVARKQLPPNVVVALSIKLRELVGTMGGGVDASDAPENIFVDIGARQDVFRIGVNVK